MAHYAITVDSGLLHQRFSGNLHEPGVAKLLESHFEPDLTDRGHVSPSDVPPSA